jgi:hypothetical protein
VNGREELVLRCAQRRREKIGTLSDEGFAELCLAVRENPTAFVDSPEQASFATLVGALDAFHRAGADDDLLDDDEFRAARERRLQALSAGCAQALSQDDSCLDAQLVQTLAAELNPDDRLDALLQIEAKADAAAELSLGATGDAWDDVFMRPRLRLWDAIARTCLDGGRYRMALEVSQGLMAASPADQVGGRLTAALALARLEDEEGFNELDARLSGRENSWLNLGRTILLYKLGRMSAARRALRGYGELCEGAAYALLRPTFVEIYLPDRPEVPAGGFEEATFAVHEAEPIIADVPDFIGWADGFPWFHAAGESYAEANGYDW